MHLTNKKSSWSLVGLLTTLALAGTGCVDLDADAGEPTLDETEQAIGNNYKITTFYSSAAKTTVVGECVTPSSCTSTRVVCWGTHPTPHYTIEFLTC